MERRVSHEGDLEGRWHFFYYSYSYAVRRAVGYVFIQNEDENGGELSKIQFEAEHYLVKSLRFVFGGRYVMNKLILFIKEQNTRSKRSVC